MTQEGFTFRELFRSEPREGEVFTPWSVNTAAGVPLTPEGFRPVYLGDPVELERRRLTDGFERQRAESLAEIEQKDAALTARMEALDRREEELAVRSSEIEAAAARNASQAGLLATLADDFGEMKKSNWAENADEIVAFAMELADKIVKERVKSDPTLMVSHLRAVLEELRVEETVAIYLAPDDLVAFQNSTATDVRALLEHPHISWLGDARLARGQIHVDTSQFRLDASVATALKNLRRDLTTAEPVFQDED